MRPQLWISSIGNERLILLFNSSNLSRRLPFRGGIIQFRTTKQEQPNLTFTQSSKETERLQRQLMRNQRKSTRTGQLYKKGSIFHGSILFRASGHIFWVSNSYLTVISERFSSHPDGKLWFSWDFFWSRLKTSINQASAIKISWHQHHPIYPLRLWVPELESTSIERECLRVLCFGQGQTEMQ